MLREINAARENNKASHQLSNSVLTRGNMPQAPRVLAEIDSSKQPQTDHRTTGIDTTGDTLLQNMRVNVLA